MSTEQVIDLLAGVLDSECKHLLTVRTCTLCKDALFNRDYAKKYGKKPKPEPKAKVETLYCQICYAKKPTSKSRATIRLPRTQHGLWEARFGIRIGDVIVSTPWCDHASGRCVCLKPPTMHGPTVEMPKVHKATHYLPDGRPVCDECCFGHCKRCKTALPKGKPGTSLGVHVPRKPGDPHPGPIASAKDLFG